MVDQVDHIDAVVGYLATQFKEAENLINYIKSLLVGANELEQLFCDIIEVRSIDNATGVYLDIIGSIVGQPRTLIDANDVTYFGFLGDPQANAFDVGRFRGPDESTGGFRDLSDVEYRAFIRARIAANNTRGTIEEIIAQIKFILDDDTQIIITEGTEAEYSVAFGRMLTDNEQLLIDSGIVPKPIGVTVTYIFT